MQGTYYTVRILQTFPEVIAECCKWDSNVRPEEIYRVYPKTSSCNCVATKRDCRHVMMVRDITDPEFINEAYRWKWDEKHGWTEVVDIPSPKEFERACC